MGIRNLLKVPDVTRALLLDMDGVIIDSLALDLSLVPQMIQLKWPDRGRDLLDASIRRHFPEPLPEFWRSIAVDLDLGISEEELVALIESHDEARALQRFDLCPGVEEIIREGSKAGLWIAVVSNNQVSDIRSILEPTGLMNLVDALIGLEQSGGVPKPEPDIYLEAVKAASLSAHECVAVEDSVIGASAAKAAGCWVVGVATGSSSFEELSSSGMTDVTITRFSPPQVDLFGEDPREKSLTTPNEFVSHMIEHILWRTGMGGHVSWYSDDWRSLGIELGRSLILGREAGRDAAVLGMIDDGSCETVLSSGASGLSVTGAHDVDIEWFLALPVEQVAAGSILVDLLEGISAGTGMGFEVQVCSVEDPHHTWEGIFRSIGMCLAELETGRGQRPTGLGGGAMATDGKLENIVVSDALDSGFGWTYEMITSLGGRVRRETAESVVEIEVDLAEGAGCRAEFDVSDSIAVDGLEELLDGLARAAGLSLVVKFHASELSSSHVVAEDIGLAFGKLLLKVAELRWQSVGMTGAGSSLRSPDDLAAVARVALSVEGRKFWKFVSLNSSYAEMRKRLLVGQTIAENLRSEDLDDFFDGLSGGLGASIMVHVESLEDPTDIWLTIFANLGRAIGQAFAEEPRRVGLPPGVKATLM
jgi:HAD superfamily hydrolase (TIGR01509 family)